MSEKRSRLDVVTGVLVIAAIGMLVVAVRRSTPAVAEPPAVRSSAGEEGWVAAWKNRAIDPVKAYRLELTGHHIGPDEPQVTIVVFSDYSCGHCIAFEPVLQRALERYPQHVAVVYRSFLPQMNEEPLMVHLAAECAADQGHFPAFHRVAFANTALIRERNGWSEMARRAAVPDLATLKECVRTRKYLDRIERDNRDGTDAGAAGTPTSYINGHVVQGKMPQPVLDSLIAYELGRMRPKKAN